MSLAPQELVLIFAVVGIVVLAIAGLLGWRPLRHRSDGDQDAR